MRYILVIFLLIGCKINAQIPSESLHFPDDFFGVYKGELNIVNSRGEETIGMEFHFNKTETFGRYQYMLVYLTKGERQERKYNLIAKDASAGAYVIDENNGILLQAKLYDNTLYTIFEVQDNLITTTERFYKEAMDFEIVFLEKSKQVETASVESEEKESSKVISYPIAGVQKAHLIKQ